MAYHILSSLRLPKHKRICGWNKAPFLAWHFSVCVLYIHDLQYLPVFILRFILTVCDSTNRRPFRNLSTAKSDVVILFSIFPSRTTQYYLFLLLGDYLCLGNFDCHHFRLCYCDISFLLYFFTDLPFLSMCLWRVSATFWFFSCFSRSDHLFHF